MSLLFKGININAEWAHGCSFIFRQGNIQILHCPSIGWL